MQSVSSAFTAEEKDSVRNIAHNLLVSWKKDIQTNRMFTIGVSLIGGGDVIGINPGAVGGPGIYRYFDESSYVTRLGWERSLNMPTGGLAKGLAEAELDNTSGRFTPRYMGGNSELFTAILPRRPFIINAGFEVDGVDQTIPQFSGILDKQPQVDTRTKRVMLHGSDYNDFFQNRYLDQTSMFTGQRTDVVIESLLSQLGMSTAQYELDTGINVIPFGLFEKGTKYSEIIGELVEAENGHFYQDEEGKFRFENRQHWDSSPHNSVARIVYTADVINAEGLNTDHIINVVEVKGKPRGKKPRQTLFKLSSPIEVTANQNKEIWIDFEDPILAVDTVLMKSNIASGSTTNSNVVYTVSQTLFAKSMKLVVTAGVNCFVNQLDIYGRPAGLLTEVYYRGQDDSSVTAYEERPLLVENDYIQDSSWANSYAQMLLNDYAEPENLQKITIRAKPSLQIGDLISWQGRYWRIFGIESDLSPSSGFTQELTLVQRTVASYFRIGISTIGGSDKIAP